MKKFLLSAFVIFSFSFYALVQRAKGENIPVAVPTSALAPTNNSPVPMMNNQGPMMGTRYKDGEYTGSVEDAYYGSVQVQVTVSGGKITNVQFLDYPHDRRTSQEINSQAMPALQAEAIQAQSANVDIVSGATATSEAFIQSLQSALSKAQS